jgi:hypothetical protein
LWCADRVVPLEAVASSYRLRFSHEHGYRFLKRDLLWTRVQVRTPEQFERWSHLVAIVFNQLFLARALGAALYRPWECKERPVTPSQVRRMMPTLLPQLGTPAHPCQPRGFAPGRPKGFHPKPAKRFAIIIKNPKKTKKSAVPLQEPAWIPLFASIVLVFLDLNAISFSFGYTLVILFYPSSII